MRAWKRHGRGERARYVAVLDPAEASVLRGLVGQVDDMLSGRADAVPQDELAALTGIRTGPSTAPDDPVLARLLPDFHRPDGNDAAGGVDPDGAALSAAMRSVNEPELITAKRDAIATLLASCPGGGGRVELTVPQAEAWLTAVNDVRLALGTALEVTEDMPEQLPPDDPRTDHLPVYHWLTWLQDSLLTVLLP
ncbi:DUF2017 domain-containing protein [Actinomycetospora sp. NBRC 106378]|uniref:DUF2017 domain-containing protein n=1 Tax=Actinomycetospora sp. NBRC 106378 TaxID=3032208 RepID=UPI0024A18EBB|nr:DUF2017 domain-containing protein [Actinomycetospora sp. NBRC 106378]GLZ54468.1 hypothetical protein Acsp07_40850 [Actinomycetospora sp. NBRC 106378]